jgi:hypothetical protein
MEYFRFGLRLTIAFVLFGTAILIVFYFTLSAAVALFAYIYTAVAVMVNSVYTVCLLIYLLRGRISAVTTLKTVGLMALGIPIAFLYAYAMVWMLDYARITFKNETSVDVGLIKIEGCQEKQISNLERGDSKTVWIKVANDCHIEIKYESEGKTKTEVVAGYVTSPNGVIASYSLGSNKDIFENRD